MLSLEEQLIRIKSGKNLAIQLEKSPSQSVVPDGLSLDEQMQMLRGSSVGQSAQPSVEASSVEEPSVEGSSVQVPEGGLETLKRRMIENSTT